VGSKKKERLLTLQDLPLRRQSKPLIQPTKPTTQQSKPPVNWQPIITLGKKTLSLALIFNSLLSIFYAIGLLSGIYANNWNVFQPYFMKGNFFWLLIAASILNIFVAMKISQNKKSYNFLFGLIITGISVASLLIFTNVSIFTIFTASTTDLMINTGRFFLLSGIAISLLEMPSMLKIIGLTPKTTQTKDNLGGKILFCLQLAMIFIIFYMFFAVIYYIGQYPEANTIANLILSFALLFTGFITFGATIFKTWLKK
jgi:hypothetical protein